MVKWVDVLIEYCISGIAKWPDFIISWFSDCHIVKALCIQIFFILTVAISPWYVKNCWSVLWFENSKPSHLYNATLQKHTYIYTLFWIYSLNGCHCTQTYDIILSHSVHVTSCKACRLYQVYSMSQYVKCFSETTQSC